MSKYLEQLFSLKGRNIIVTNASTGFGAAVVQGLAQSGAVVCGTGKPHISAWQPSKSEFYIRCNIENPPTFQFLCDELYKNYGKLNVLINVEEVETPAAASHADFSTTTSFRESLDIQLNSLISASRISSQYIKKSGGGSIINIISIKNAMGFPDDYSYVATKNALLMTTKELAADLIKDNVRVNNIVLGYVQNLTSSEPNNYQINDHQWKDLIGTTIYLASESSASITGQDIFIISDRLTTSIS